MHAQTWESVVLAGAGKSFAGEIFDPAAEAAVDFIGLFAARLKVAPFQSRREIKFSATS